MSKKHRMVKGMTNITLKVDNQLLEEARKTAKIKKTSINTLVFQRLKEFVAGDQKKQAALDGLAAFYRETKARIGKPRWTREDLHER
jgi:hypothetical protein